MKYYQISFPGEFGQHVDEIWSEKQILKAYYPHWCSMMVQNVAAPDLNEKTCIDDWCVTHWAVEVPKPEWITEPVDEKQEAYDFLVRAGIIRPNERKLTGTEAECMIILLAKEKPYKTTNNQRFITEYYKYNGMEYSMTDLEGEIEVIEYETKN